MKLTFKQQDLHYATSIVHSMVSTKSTLPILGNILLRPKKDQVTFISSDLESCAECTCKAVVEDGGEVTIPADTFTEIVHELPDADVTMDFLSTHCEVHCDENEYRLQTMSSEDFPIWSGFDPVVSFELPQKALRRLISKILFAVPQQDPRRALLGGFFEIKENKLQLVGTDGKKLGYAEVPLPEIKGSDEAVAIVPIRVLGELQRVLKDEGSVSINIGERQCSFTLDSVVFYTNLIEGTYPNYRLVIPKEFEKEILLDVAPLSQTIKRASVISETRNHSIKFSFKTTGEDMKESHLLITAVSYDLGSYEGVMPLKYEGEEFDIAFNHRYFLEALRCVDTDKILMKIKNPKTPIIINEEGVEDCFYLLMPIKITEIEETGGE